METIIFGPAFFPAILGIFCAALMVFIFTTQGSNFFIRFFLGKIVKDFGDVGSTKLLGVTQTLRLVECSKNGQNFYIMETRGYFNKQYIKISQETAKKLVDSFLSE